MNSSGDTASPWTMPELHWDAGYPALWLAMIGIGGATSWQLRGRG